MADGDTPLFEAAEIDPAQARLARLADFGLEVTAAIAARARDAGPEEDLNALAMAYARAARAVRLTLLLQSKLSDRPAPLDPRRAAEDLAKDRVARIVHRVIAAEHDDADRIDRLDAEACERVEDEDCYGSVLARPISDMVADICADLGLNPDWTALAKECWAIEEIKSGEVGEPLSPYLPRFGETAGGGPLAAERVVEGASGERTLSASFLSDSS